MNEGEHIQVTKLENGFIVASNGRSYTADDLSGVANLAAKAFGLISGCVDMASGPDRTVMMRRSPAMFTRTMEGCDDVPQSASQMRDELGELRRFKERAIKRDDEKTQSITQLADQVADMKAQRDDYRKKYCDKMVECDAAEELAGNLQGQLLQRQAKRKAKAKKKSSGRKA